jgi:hypothetical protein
MWTELCPPSNPYIEYLAPNVIIIADRGFFALFVDLLYTVLIKHGQK